MNVQFSPNESKNGIGKSNELNLSFDEKWICSPLNIELSEQIYNDILG